MYAPSPHLAVIHSLTYHHIPLPSLLHNRTPQRLTPSTNYTWPTGNPRYEYTQRPKISLVTVMVMVIVCSSRPFYLVHGCFTVLNITLTYSVTHGPARWDDYAFVISIDTLTDRGFTLYCHYSRYLYVGWGLVLFSSSNQCWYSLVVCAFRSLSAHYTMAVGMSSDILLQVDGVERGRSGL
ncbi:hypothetical protein BDR07DRAFT_900417 [Suillus spraguei]|nr:hypothetical protein BDR07DRAFT_900417 [Suillus spraguei]